MLKFFYIPVALFLFSVLHLCPAHAQMKTKAIYICNEGLFNRNDGTLAYFNFDNKTEDLNFFETRNRRGLGDTPNQIQQYGSKIYVVVSVSSQIEVIDATNGKSLKQIPMFTSGNKPKQPRNITFYENKAYVSSFDGTVTRIDTATLAIDGSTQVGRNPEGICAWGGKLYVANSGGLDSPNYDNTVSVIDIQSFAEIRKITVGMNPYRIQPDGMGGVFVSTRGNYENTVYSFKRIDAETYEVLDMKIDVLSFAISGDYAYLYNYDFSKNISWIKLFNLKTGTVERDNFITDGTTIRCPYNISVNPANGDVYVCNAGKNFVEQGDVYCFDSFGKLKTKYTSVGLNPNGVVFINTGEPVGINTLQKELPAIAVYPNPATTTITVESEQVAIGKTIGIYNAANVFVQSATITSTRTTINIADLPKGVYFVQIPCKGKVVIKTVVNY